MDQGISQGENMNLPRKRRRLQEDPTTFEEEATTKHGRCLDIAGHDDGERQQQRLAWVRQARQWKLENDKLKNCTAGFCFQLRRATQQIKSLQDRIRVLETKRENCREAGTQADEEASESVANQGTHERETSEPEADGSKHERETSESVSLNQGKHELEKMKLHYDTLLAQEKQRIQAEFVKECARREGKMAAKHAKAALVQQEEHAETVRLLREDLAKQMPVHTETTSRERALAPELNRLRQKFEEVTSALEKQRGASKIEKTQLQKVAETHKRALDDSRQTLQAKINQYEGRVERLEAENVCLQTKMNQYEERVEELETENACLLAFLDNYDPRPQNRPGDPGSVSTNPVNSASEPSQPTGTDKEVKDTATAQPAQLNAEGEHQTAASHPAKKRRSFREPNWDKMYNLASTFADKFEHVNLKQLASWVGNWKRRISTSMSASHAAKRECFDKIGFFSAAHMVEEVPADRPLVDGVAVSLGTDVNWNKMFKCYQEVGRTLGTYDVAKLDRWIRKWKVHFHENEGKNLDGEEELRIQKLRLIVDCEAFQPTIIDQPPRNKFVAVTNINKVNMNKLIDFRTKFGETRVPKEYDTSLHFWEKRMMSLFQTQMGGERKVLSDDIMEKLKEIKLTRCGPQPMGRDSMWRQMAGLLLAYKAKHGDCKVLASFDKQLHSWVLHQADLVNKRTATLIGREGGRQNYLLANGLFEPLRKAIAVLGKNEKGDEQKSS